MKPTRINLPASKSIGARFLVATYFGGTLPADPYFEDNDDLLVLQQALLAIYSDEEPIDYGDTPVDVHASGTAFRFITAVCASSPGADFVITGTPRLCSRPMSPLIDVLRKAGAIITPMGLNDTGPYRISGKELEGGEFSIAGNISSQFISALMLVAPSWHKGMDLHFTTPLVSRPYLEMTASLMRDFGIDLELDDNHVSVKPGKYKEPEGFRVEADWSSASFFYEACALGAGDLVLADLASPSASCQGDAACADIFRQLGVGSSFSDDGALLSKQVAEVSSLEYDFRDCPDLVLPVAVGCLSLDVPFRFSGVANLRLKESDRIDSLQKESRRLGYLVDAGEDFVEWKGRRCNPDKNPVIDPHDDHRVAMAFAMVALKTGSIKISHPAVVEKSFAMFWEELPKLPLSITLENDGMLIQKNS